MQKVFKLLFHRVIWFSLAMALQGFLLVLFITSFFNLFVYFYGGSVLLSLAVVIAVINSTSKSAYKIAWIVLIMLFPIFGGIFYILFGASRLSKRLRRKMRSITATMADALIPGGPAAELNIDDAAGLQSRYIRDYAFCPPYTCSKTRFFASGEEKFQALIAALETAETFIFLEYFIIEEGVMWNTILSILERKAKAGVDVRVIYDDVGCLFTLPYGYDRRLEAKGIKCCVFNRFVPLLRSRLNNRDHRKIAVIDGRIGFTGGLNLADEYINVKEKYGHWKDTAIQIDGPAVWSLTVMFLSLWDYLRGSEEDFREFRAPAPAASDGSEGVVQPFTDNPLDDEPVGETVYMNLINKAKSYIYITTPYLVIDAEMTANLCNAAKAGIDVRIITPHKPDKWYVHMVTRANYPVLLAAGVKILEYTPGFMHSKTFVVDDRYAVVGTINLDYRSLYLHFECGVWLYKTASVGQLKADFERTQARCQPVTRQQMAQLPPLVAAGRSVMRLFAPLM